MRAADGRRQRAADRRLPTLLLVCGADQATARVRAVHHRFRGELPEAVGRFPAGTPWTADDPDLLLWIIATLVDSGLLVYQRYVRGLSRAERQAYWADWRIVGGLFGLTEDEMPATVEQLEGYVRATIDSDLLHVSPKARELGVRIVLHPPVSPPFRPLIALANFITIGLLPASIRRQYGLGWDPIRGLALSVGAEYARRLLVPMLPGPIRYAHRQALAAA
jgi:uncharacterized protein (DUF2236 family)